MFEQVIPILTNGAVLVAITMTFCFLGALLATVRQSRSRLLADLEPVLLWVEIQTINMRFPALSRFRALFVFFLTLGLLLWMFLAVLTLGLHLISPDLLRLLLQI